MALKQNQTDQFHLNSTKNRSWTGLITFFILLVLWEIVSKVSGWSEDVFPDPITVVSSLVELIANGTLLRHTIASLFRVTAGFYMAIIFGIPLGIILGRIESVRILINPVVQFLKPISI